MGCRERRIQGYLSVNASYRVSLRGSVGKWRSTDWTNHRVNRPRRALWPGVAAPMRSRWRCSSSTRVLVALWAMKFTSTSVTSAASYFHWAVDLPGEQQAGEAGCPHASTLPHSHCEPSLADLVPAAAGPGLDHLTSLIGECIDRMRARPPAAHVRWRTPRRLALRARLHRNAFAHRRGRNSRSLLLLLRTALDLAGRRRAPIPRIGPARRA